MLPTKQFLPPAYPLRQARLQEEFFRANATAGNLQRERTPESDDEVDENVKARREAEVNRERKIKRRLKRERQARGEVADDDDDDDDDDDEEDDEEDSLFGSVSAFMMLMDSQLLSYLRVGRREHGCGGTRRQAQR